MEAQADLHGRFVPGHIDLAAVMTEADGTRTSMLRRVLSELQHDARDVFACSGETVDLFLRDRQVEAWREFGVQP